MTEHVKVAEAGGVMEILLDRADKKNALSNDMYDAITAALASAAESDVRAVVIGSTGNDFTAGNDLADFAKVAMGGGEARAHQFIEAIAQFPKPIVAAVPGLAVGVGTTLLLHCDLVYVAEEAKLSTPFVNLALVPEAASSLLLTARIGHVRAFEMFALGTPVSGADAVTLGLANAVAPRDGVLGLARDAAARLAAKSVGAVVASKRLMRDGEAVLARLRAESAVFGERLKSRSAREAFTAFMERRAPNFEGLD